MLFFLSFFSDFHVLILDVFVSRLRRVENYLLIELLGVTQTNSDITEHITS